MQVVCPLCSTRVSEWMIAAGKTIAVNGDTCHKSCLIDYYLRTGRQFAEEGHREHESTQESNRN